MRKRNWSDYNKQLVQRGSLTFLIDPKIFKINDNEFIFFDPGKGEFRGLTLNGLANKMNEQIEENKGTDILLSKGSDYLKKLENKKILQVLKKNITSQDSSSN